MIVEVNPRQREFLRLLWRERRLSRWELHEHTLVNPKTVGHEVAGLLELSLLRECPSEPLGRGRPRVPLEIDPTVRNVVGVAISPGHVEACRLNLCGGLVDPPVALEVAEIERIIPTARDLLSATLNGRTLAVGVSATGMIDPQKPALLVSSVTQGKGTASLAPLLEAAGDRALVLENDMHALAARWLLSHEAESSEDVLMVSIDDGQLGAALLIAGRPNRGCATGANELGHTRFFVETDVCYCGHPGCLERICSTPFLRRRDGLHAGGGHDGNGHAEGTLMQRAARFDGAASSDSSLATMIDYLSCGLANAVNFIRPNRLVLVTELVRYAAFHAELMARTRGRLLGDLVSRVRFEFWDQSAAQTAETAAWLALANLYREGWSPAGT